MASGPNNQFLKGGTRTGPAMKTNNSGTRGMPLHHFTTHESGFGSPNYPLPHLAKARNIDPGFAATMPRGKTPGFVAKLPKPPNMDPGFSGGS